MVKKVNCNESLKVKQFDFLFFFYKTQNITSPSVIDIIV